MSDWVGLCYIETGYGFNPHKSTVIQYESLDEYGRGVNGKCVFIGEWDEAIEYAKTIQQ